MNPIGAAGILLDATGWSLVHFVWQAGLVGALYAVARAVLPRGNPRYVASMLAMVALAVLPGCTIWHEVWVLAHPIRAGGAIVFASGGVSAAPFSPGGFDLQDTLGAMLPWLVLGWGCGVLWLGARVARQWRGLRAIVRAAEASPVWQARAHRLARRLGLRRAIRVLVSVRIATPTLVGWVRPAIVLPLALLARMPSEQVDLILAHELAHLRRLDHLANLFQVVLETLFFYHPVVYWISREARNERELCCDALALRAAGGSPRDFVAALVELAEFHRARADVALAASGGVLVERAGFITGSVAMRPRAQHPWLLLAVLLLGLTGAFALARWQQVEHVEAVIAMNATALRAGVVVDVGDWPGPRVLDLRARRPALAPIVAVADAVPTASAVPFALDAFAPRTMRLAVSGVASMPVRVPAGVAEWPVRDVPQATLAAPRPVRAPPPVYPAQALMNGVQGQVVVAFSLDAAGVPRDLHVVRSAVGGAFDAAALAALARWRFAPRATSSARYSQVFSFRLDGAGSAEATPAAACLVRTGTHICRPLDAAREGNPAGTVRTMGATGSGVSR
ncbi:MAG TPA: M56 family metallopeptidase [Rhodanobacteraceae bacterium]|nr:M56 family metallopeptidase [Rhodanobacteraceae bacterium]